MATIVTYLRKANIVHRDLKPANFLVNERWHLLLADFGTASKVKSPTMNWRQLPQPGRKRSMSVNLENPFDEESYVGT